MDLTSFLRAMAAKGASDMFFTCGAPVQMKVEGKMHALGDTPLPASMTQSVAYTLMSDKQIAQFERDLEMNFAVAVEGSGRFRVNVFKQKGEVGMVIRAIKTEIPGFGELKLPPVLQDIIMAKRGLVLVVGSTGSGKSTTLASMIDYRNSISGGHILTIEDPIEFIHPHKKCIVNQREVGVDTHAFSNALKNAMREAPDVILIGEILDAATMEAAIAFAETGHLCLATLHSNSADQTIERILNFFPETAHKNILMNVALNLKAVVSQRLVIGTSGKRLPAVEVMLNTPMIRELLRKGHVHEVKEAMEKSLSDGMQTFDQHLFQLAKRGEITEETAIAVSDSPDGLSLKFKLSEGHSGEHDPYATQEQGPPPPPGLLAGSSAYDF